MKKWIALGLTVLLLLGSGLAVAVAQHWPSRRLQAVNLSYIKPEWKVNWSLPPGDLKELDQVRQEAIGVWTPAWPEHYYQYRVDFEYPDAIETLYVSWDHQVYCPIEEKLYPDLGTALVPYLEAMDASFFGTPLDWSTVSQLWPRKTKALVTDLDTQKSFWMFRWGGNLHADVEPVTREDAATMKEIYGDYTWRRRAVIVEVQGHRIAGSLHSMPHGGGDIRGNDFPGHCCLHFNGSTTHGTRKEDPAHGLMLKKAAGLWWHTLREADAAIWAHHFLTLMAQRDFSTLNFLMVEDEQDRIRKLALQLSSMRIAEVSVAREGLTQADVVAAITVYLDGDWNPHELEARLRLEHNPLTQVWQLVDFSGW